MFIGTAPRSCNILGGRPATTRRFETLEVCGGLYGYAFCADYGRSVAEETEQLDGRPFVFQIVII
jgi:hypothetical protein